MDDRYSETTDDLHSFIDQATTVFDKCHWTADSLSSFRKADTLRNLMDQLVLKQEKQASVDKYYDTLEYQLSENFRLSIVELYSKRNDAVSRVDSLLDSIISKLERETKSLKSWISSMRQKQPRYGELVLNIKKKLNEENFENFKDLVHQCKHLLSSSIPEPAITYENIRLDVSKVDLKVSLGHSQQSKHTQTSSRKDRVFSEFTGGKEFSSVDHCDRILRNNSNLSFSSVHNNKEKLKIPFLGINRIKVYLPHSYTKFSVVSVSPHTTVRQVIDGLLEHIGREGKYYLEIRVSGHSIVLKPYDLISDVLSEHTNHPSLILLVKD